MSRRTGRNNNYTSGMAPSGFFRAEVVAVSGEYVSVKVSRLGLNNIYENVPFTGFSPAVGDRVWVSFVEGRASHLLAFVGAGDTSTDITEIVAGTNLNGGGTGGSITVNLDDDITLSSVTADAFYGELYGAIHILVKNVSGGSLAKGTPVYATGAVGASGAVEVEASLAGTSSTMPAMGLLDQDLANNGQGDVVVSGVLQHIDTDTPGYSVGDELYVAASGGLTTTRPTGSSQLVQKIGKVIRVQQNTGEILVQGAGRTNDVPNSFTTSGDVTVGGDLTVNGTTVTLNTETLTVEDNIIVLNSNVTGTPSLDAGIEVERGSSSNVSFLWDESADAWTIGAVDFVVDTNTLFVDASTDRVGIGTTSPAEKLNVIGDIRIGKDDDSYLIFEDTVTPSESFIKHDSVDGSLVLAADQGNDLADSGISMRVDSVTRMRLDSSGNLGIGTTTPGSPLHLFGAGNSVDQIRISSNTGTVSEYGFLAADASTNVMRYGYWTGSAFGNHHFEGNVGIGRSNPDTLLHVNGAVTISSDTGVGNTHFPFTDGRFYYTADPETGGTGDHVFRHYSGGSYVEQMRILENGNVGINDSTPSYKLDVAGDIRATGRVRTDLIGTSGGDDLGIGAGETANKMAGNISGEHLWLGAEGNINLVTSPDNWASGWAGRDETHLSPLTDGSLRVTSDSGYIDIGPKNTTYCHIYTDRGSFYFNKSVLYANSTSNKIWHAGNDGSGSGLDADLLDGNQASAFITTSTTQSNNLYIRNSSPTIYMRDTNNRAGMLHQNSNIFYVLRASGNDSTTWQTTQGEWPLVVRVDNNEVVAGGQVRVPNMDGTGSYNTCRYNTSNGHIMHFTSLAEHKTDIVEINGVLGSLNERSLLHDLRPILFHENQETATTRGEYIPGFIAEEVHEVAPELTYYDRNGELISYSPEALVPHLVAEIQRLNGMVEELYRNAHPDWTPPQPRPSDRGDDEKAVFDAGAAYTVANPVVIPPPNVPIEPEEPTE